MTGSVLTASSTTILGVDTTDGGRYWTLVPPATSPTYLDLTTGLPSGAAIDYSGGNAVKAVLSPPSAAHASGLVVLIVDATTPASGLTPQSDNTYLVVFDAKSGAMTSHNQIAAVAPSGFGVSMPAPLAANDNTVGLREESVDQTTLTHAYAIDDRDLTTGAITGSTPIPSTRTFADASGTRAIYTDDNATVDNNSLYEYDVMTRQETTITLGKGVGGTPEFASPSIIAIHTENGLWEYSADSGAQVYANLATGTEPTLIQGARSTVYAAVANNFAALFGVNDGSLVFSIPNVSALNLSIQGIADDLLWATTTSGNIIVDKTGKQLASSWTVVPTKFGGSNWTVFRHATGSSGSGALLLAAQPSQVLGALASAPQ